MKFLVTFFALLVPLGAQQNIRDYKVPVPASVAERVNDTWQKLGQSYRLVSEDIHYRLRDDRTSSIYGRLKISCRPGFEPAVNYVFSGQPGVSEKFGKKMETDGLKPVESVDHAIAYINSEEKSQVKLVALVSSILIGVCSDKEQPTEPFVALSLWLTPYERAFSYSAARVSREKFEQLK
jgi:hypothetical protein